MLREVKFRLSENLWDVIALVPTFRSSCYTSAATFHELRKVMGASQTYDSRAAFLFDVPGSNSQLMVQERQIGGTSWVLRLVGRCSEPPAARRVRPRKCLGENMLCSCGKRIA